MKVECAGTRGAAELAEGKRDRFGREMERAEGRAKAKRVAGAVDGGAEVRVGFAGAVAVGSGVRGRSPTASPGGSEGDGLETAAAARVTVSVRAGRDADRPRVEIAAGEHLACALEQGPRGVEIRVCAAPALLPAARAGLQAVAAELRRRGVRVARAELRARECSGGDSPRSPGGSRRMAR